MSLTGFNITNFPSDVLFDAGVVYASSTKLFATKGPPKLSQNSSVTNVEFDGKYAPVKLLDRVVHGEPVISLTLMEIGDAATGNQITTLLPGHSTSSVTGIVTHIPQPSGAFVASASYITDFRVVWERGYIGSGAYFAVHFATGLCSKFDIQGVSKDNAMISAEFVGRTLGTTLTSAAYDFEYRTALP